MSSYLRRRPLRSVSSWDQAKYNFAFAWQMICHEVGRRGLVWWHWWAAPRMPLETLKAFNDFVRTLPIPPGPEDL